MARAAKLGPHGVKLRGMIAAISERLLKHQIFSTLLLSMWPFFLPRIAPNEEPAQE
jgi:hypothetical protein